MPVFLGQRFVVLRSTVGVLADVGRGRHAHGDELLDDLHGEEVEQERATHRRGRADLVGKTGRVDSRIARHAAVVQNVVAQFVKLLAGDVARSGGLRHLKRGQHDHIETGCLRLQRDFDRAGVAPGIGNDEHDIAGLDCVLVGVALEEAGAVAHDLLRPAVGWVVDTADRHEPARTPLNLGRQNLRMPGAECVEHAVRRETLRDAFASRLERGLVALVNTGLERLCAVVEFLGEGHDEEHHCFRPSRASMQFTLVNLPQMQI